MITRRLLGRTKLNVSCLGFGSLGILDRYMARWDVEPGHEAAKQIIETALDEGINFIDTARWYENSEERIGSVIASRRQDCILASKTFQREADGVRREIEESLDNLQTDYIEIYKVHHVQWEDELTKVLAPGGALEGLHQAQKEGLIGFTGISGHRPELLQQAVATREFDVVELPYNILDHQIYQPVIEQAHALNLGVITMKALAAGLLGDKSEESLRFAFANSKIDCVVVGMSTTSQVNFNSKIAIESAKISEEEQQNLYQELTEYPADYWGLCCEHYDLNKCPFCVPIDEVLWLERYRNIYKSGHHAKWLYLRLPVQADLCQDCPGYCQTYCPQQMSIQKLLVEAHCNLSNSITLREILQHRGEVRTEP